MRPRWPEWTGKRSGIGFTAIMRKGRADCLTGRVPVASPFFKLLDRPRSGRKPLLQPDQLAELEQIVETPPDPVKDGVVRWRCADLKAGHCTPLRGRGLGTVRWAHSQ